MRTSMAAWHLLFVALIAPTALSLGCQRSSGYVATDPQGRSETVSQISPRDGESGAKSSARGDETAARPTANDATDSALAIFQRRIVPILRASNPSSCSECHLSGVDLKGYILDTQEETFAALRDAGLIDVAQPDRSKLLTFISRRPEKPNLVTERVRQEEFEAFRAWIRAAARDPMLAAAKTADARLGPDLPVAVVRHARRDRILASFIESIWSEVGRCAACHSPDRNQKQVAEHGEQVSWIKLGDPAATLTYMLEAGLIDLDEPDQSLLLLKPTNQVEHGGGQKMLVGDRTYKQFRRFIEDYAATAQGAYRTADELPPLEEEVSQVVDVWFKLEEVPEQFDKMLLAVDLYRWDDAAGDWSRDRWATADRAVFGKGRLWQQHLSLTAPRGSARARDLAKQQTLPAGKYLVKIYVDQKGKLRDEYPAELGPEELVGQIEVNSQWPAGYGSMTAGRYPQR